MVTVVFWVACIVVGLFGLNLYSGTYCELVGVLALHGLLCAGGVSSVYRLVVLYCWAVWFSPFGFVLVGFVDSGDCWFLMVGLVGLVGWRFAELVWLILNFWLVLRM